MRPKSIYQSPEMSVHARMALLVRVSTEREALTHMRNELVRELATFSDEALAESSMSRPSMVAIAEAAGLSRARVYQLLKEGQE